MGSVYTAPSDCGIERVRVNGQPVHLDPENQTGNFVYWPSGAVDDDISAYGDSFAVSFWCAYNGTPETIYEIDYRFRIGEKRRIEPQSLTALHACFHESLAAAEETLAALARASRSDSKPKVTANGLKHPQTFESQQ